MQDSCDCEIFFISKTKLRSWAAEVLEADHFLLSAYESRLVGNDPTIFSQSFCRNGFALQQLRLTFQLQASLWCDHVWNRQFVACWKFWQFLHIGMGLNVLQWVEFMNTVNARSIQRLRYAMRWQFCARKAKVIDFIFQRNSSFRGVGVFFGDEYILGHHKKNFVLKFCILSL